MQAIIDVGPLVVVLPLIAFWMWMFSALWRNEDLPVSSDPLLSWPPESKNAWTIVFVVLNIFGAAIYWSQVYRQQD